MFVMGIKRDRETGGYSSNTGGCLELVGLPIIFGLVAGAYVAMARDSYSSYSPEITKIELTQDDPYHMRISTSRPLQIAHPRIQKILRDAEAKCNLNTPITQNGSVEITEFVLDTRVRNCSAMIDKP